MEAKGGRFAALRRPLRPWSHGTLMYLLALLDFRPECGIRSFLPGIVKVTAFRNHLSPKLPHMARLPELRKAKLLTTGTLDNAIDGAPRDDERSNLDGKYTNLIPPIIHTSSGTLSQETDLSPSGNISIPSAVDLLLAAETGYIIPTQIYEVLSDSATVSDSEILESEQTHSTIQEDRLDVVVPPNLQDVFEEGHKGIKSKPVDSPGVAKILRFAVPAIGVWLCGPILSLIDTSAVGLLSGTAHQAALSPAVAVSDYGALLMVRRER